MRRLYRAFLARLLPQPFLKKHGVEMELLFEEGLRSRRGPSSRLAFTLVSILDVVRARWMLARSKTVVSRRGSKGAPPMEQLLMEVKLGLRSLTKRWELALLAIVTLALGIGSVTTVYSFVHGVLLRPLPYEGSERIGILWHDLGGGAQSLPAVNELDYLDYRDRSRLFEAWTIATGRERILGERDEAEIVDVGLVERSFFSFFGAELAHGRDFSTEEDAPGGPSVAILTHRLFARRFGGDPEVVGRTVELGGEPHTIVGVLSAGFRLLLPPEAFLLRDAEIYLPAQIDPGDAPPRNYTGYTVFGRLAPGVSFEQAQQEIEILEAQLKEEHAVHAAANLQARIVPLHGDVVKGVAPSLRLLMAAVGFVLLIACGNVAQLLLARFRSGERELSLRAALGASRFRLARIVLVESALLALAGGALGVALAHVGVSALRRLASESVPRLDAVAVDVRVLGFAVALSLAAAVLFGLVPAVSLSRSNIAAALADGGRGRGSRRQTRLRSALIVAELAFSVVLLVGAGLSIRSFAALLESPPGFEPSGLMTFRLSLPPADFEEEERRRVFFDDLRERLRALPGVESVAATSQLPLTGSGRLQPYAYDAETATNWESVTADEREVSPDFFETVGARLLAGREFAPADANSERRVIVIDETLAEQAFPGESAVGRTLQVEPNGSEDPLAKVVGVVSHVKLHDVARSMLPQIYLPFYASPTFNVVVRTANDPAELAPLLRDQVSALASGVAVEDVLPMSTLVERARSTAELSLVLMVGFGAFAVVLAAVGLFGVISHAVGLRRAELGIRMALGASPGGVQRAVLAEGLGPAAGLVLSAGLGGFMTRMLVGVRAVDALTYVAVAGALVVVALAACWMPARRATRVDPATVLRAE